jgi:hypothetical protein
MSVRLEQGAEADENLVLCHFNKRPYLCLPFCSFSFALAPLLFLLFLLLLPLFSSAARSASSSVLSTHRLSTWSGRKILILDVWYIQSAFLESILHTCSMEDEYILRQKWTYQQSVSMREGGRFEARLQSTQPTTRGIYVRVQATTYQSAMFVTLACYASQPECFYSSRDVQMSRQKFKGLASYVDFRALS